MRGANGVPTTFSKRAAATSGGQLPQEEIPMTAPPVLPYFDFILAMLGQGNLAVEKSLGRHVHFGYWSDPALAQNTNDDYAQAAEQLTQELIGISRVSPGDRVLDVGCGFGGTLASVNERYQNMRLVGLNLEMRQLERAPHVIGPTHSNSLALCQGDACALPFGSGTLDRVLAVECIFHFPSRERFLREAFRVLRPGGIIALSDFVPFQPFRPLARAATESSALSRFQYFGRCNLNWTKRDYRQLVREIGYQPLTERNVTRNILPTYRYLKSLLTREAAIEGITDSVTHFMDALRLLGALGLLSYYFMAFRKP